VPKNSASSNEMKRAGVRPGPNECGRGEGGEGYGTSSLEAWALAGAAAQLLGIGKEREWWDSDSD
jgi:hypothetical protein